MARLDKVFVVLENEFDLAVTQSSITNVGNDTVRDRNLWTKSENMSTSLSTTSYLGKAIENLRELVSENSSNKYNSHRLQ